jgi:uncharacterized membrane protein
MPEAPALIPGLPFPARGRRRPAPWRLRDTESNGVAGKLAGQMGRRNVNYLFVRDLAAAAGLTAFSIVIAPFVYYVHEKAWDYYDATKARSPVVPALKLLPAAA